MDNRKNKHLKIEIHNQFEKDDICLAKIEYLDNLGNVIKTIDDVFCELRQDYFIYSKPKSMYEKEFKKAVKLIITTYKKVGSKAIL